MREFITGLAIILIAVLSTALVGPYFVDWNSQRTLLETQISRTLGQKVTIGGNIDLKLLPTPYLVLSQTVIGSDDGPVTIGIRHLDLQLSVAPLLHGEFEVVEALLEEPTIRVTLQPDRTLPSLPDAPAFRANIRFDRIHIADGTLAVADPQSGRTLVVDKLAVDAEAPSLSGPFKGNGSFGEGEALTKFRFSTTTFHADRSRVRLLVDENLKHAGVDLDGEITLREVQKDVVRQSFDGTLLATGHLWNEAGTPTAWRLAGPLKADPESARLDGADLRLGTDDAGLSLKADVTGDFGDDPRLHVDMSAKQLDIDRLSGTPLDAAKPAPPKLPGLDSLRHLLADVTPPLPTTVDLSIDTATYGGDTLRDVEAHLGLGGKGPEKLKVAGDGPGGVHLELAGTLSPDAARPFTGTVDFKAEKLSETLDWLSSVAPDITLKSKDLPIQAMSLAGRVNAGREAIDLDDLALDLGRSRLTGTANLALGAGSRATKLTTVLKAKTLDVDQLPRFDAFRDSAVPLDLDVRLNADALRVSNLGDDGLDAGRIDMVLAKTGGVFELKRLGAKNFGGANVDATGRLDKQGAKVAMSVAAAKLDKAVDLLRQLAPSDVAASLPKNVAVLAPANLRLDATFVSAKDGGLEPSRLLIAGQFASTKLDASLVPDENRPGAVSLEATTESPQGSLLLRQLGYAALPIDTIGKSRVILSAHGSWDQPLETSLQATLGASRADFQGRFALRDLSSASASGAVKLRSADLGPMLRTLGVAYPDLTGTVPVAVGGTIAFDRSGATLSKLKGRLEDTSVSGMLHWQNGNTEKPALTGSLAMDRLSLSGLLALALGPGHPPADNAKWSNAPFGPGLSNTPRTDVSLTSRAFELDDHVVAKDAVLDLGLAPNVVTIRGLKASVAGGTIAGDMSVRRDGAQATVEGTVQADNVQIDIPSLSTKLSGKLEMAGSGKSPLALVSSLAGSGDATWDDTVIPGADPNALPKIFADVEDDALAVDDDSIVRSLDSVATQPLRAGTRRFGLSVANGTLTLDPKGDVPASDEKVSSTLAAALDLRRMRLDERLQQTLKTLPKNWTGTAPSIGVTLSGPFAAPRRFWDVGNFINAVAARAIARESARIEAYEFDVRERAIFNQRLQSERRREQDRRKAEADAKAAAAEAARRAAAEAARRAEADRRNRAEAARLEKQRQDEAAKSLREQAPEPPTAPAPQTDRSDRSRFEAPGAGTYSDPAAAGRY